MREHQRGVTIAIALTEGAIETPLYQPGTLESSTKLAGYSYVGKVEELRMRGEGLRNPYRFSLWLQRPNGERLFLRRSIEIGAEEEISLLSVLTPRDSYRLGSENLLGITVDRGFLGFGQRIVFEGFATETGYAPGVESATAGTVWGEIAGLIDEQSDLSDALNNRVLLTEYNQAIQGLTEDISQVEAIPGPVGASAYDIWIDAGNSGTEADFLASLEGPPGPDGDQGVAGPPGGSSEFNYYGASVPSSPTEGETWRETTTGGIWVADWVRNGAIWLSQKEEYEFRPITIGSSTTNLLQPFLSPGNWAFRWKMLATPSISSDVWNVNLRKVTLSPIPGNGFTYTTVANFSSPPNQQADIDSGWLEIQDIEMISPLITRSGTGSLNGVITLLRRKVR